MKLHTVAFAARTQAQGLSGKSIVPHDSVCFGSTPIKLATVTAEEVARYGSAKKLSLIASCIHEMGHAIGMLLKKMRIAKIEVNRAEHEKVILKGKLKSIVGGSVLPEQGSHFNGWSFEARCKLAGYDVAAGPITQGSRLG